MTNRGMAGGAAASGSFARRAWVVLRLLWAASPVSLLSMLALALVAGTTPTATAWLQRAVLDSLVPTKAGTAPRPGGPVASQMPVGFPHGAAIGHVVVLAVMLGGVAMVAAMAQYARNFVESELRRGLGVIIPGRVFKAVNSFPGIGRFESPEFADKIRICQQLSTNTAARLVTSGLQCSQSLVTAVGMLGTLELISPLMTAIAAGTAVPAITAQIANSRRRADLEWKKSPTMRKQLFYGRLLSDRDAAKEVRLFGLGDFLSGRMLAELRSVNRGQRALDLRIFLIEGSLSVMCAAIAAGGTVWVVRQAALGKLSVGDVSMFAMAIISVQVAISGAVSRLADVYQSLLLFGHYMDVTSAQPDLPIAALPQRLHELRTGIEIRDVWFRYDDAHPWVLDGVTMFIPAGRSVALIGLNGAGKSTLVKLICRFYDPARGSILWDGIDIRDVAPEDLRARIGTVFQDYMAYDLTAADNIGIGDLGRLKDVDRIQEAAERSGVHGKLASLPHGYETLLSRVFFSNKERESPETGVLLSGGEWQRVALARGLMRADRDLLILDEPSSGMDAEAEHAMHQRLRAARLGRTSLLISHRLSSVRDADVIYVLSAGHIVEQGTHAALMAADGEYSRLFTLQASGYKDSPASDASCCVGVSPAAGSGRVLPAAVMPASSPADGRPGTPGNPDHASPQDQQPGAACRPCRQTVPAPSP